jgi:hypothetical protein
MEIESIDIEIFGRSLTAGQNVTKKPLHGTFDGNQVRHNLMGRPSGAILIDFLGQLLSGQRSEKSYAMIQALLEGVDDVLASIQSVSPLFYNLILRL